MRAPVSGAPIARSISVLAWVANTALRIRKFTNGSPPGFDRGVPPSVVMGRALMGGIMAGHSLPRSLEEPVNSQGTDLWARNA